MFETVSVIGGDLRQLTLAKLMRKEGYHVFLYGFDKDIQTDDIDTESDIDFVLGSDIIILPVPVTFDGSTINSPYAKNAMTVDELIDGINPSAIVFGGQIQPNLAKAFENNSIAYRDYLKREELSIKNAIPTALTIQRKTNGITKTVMPFTILFSLQFTSIHFNPIHIHRILKSYFPNFPTDRFLPCHTPYRSCQNA